jgi:myosin-crossreactive antigen
MSTPEIKNYVNRTTFEQWVPNENDRYFTVEYSVRGVEFLCYVKCDLDKKDWVTVFVNQSNPRNCFIRRESVSRELWQQRKLLTYGEWKSKFDQVVLTCEQ